MEASEYIQVGVKGEGDFSVTEEYSAEKVGSGSLEVLATPWLIAFMERIAHSLLQQLLPEGYSSVGTVVDVQHLAPTPVGADVHVQCEVVEVEGRRVSFRVLAWDGTGKIGEGRHQRAVIDVARFIQRLQSR